MGTRANKNLPCLLRRVFPALAIKGGFMKIRYLPVTILVLLVTACSHPVPADKLDYVGEWKSREMYLLILKDGTVSYKRLKGGGTVTVNGPLKEFSGNDFVVGFGFLTTTFNVAQPPVKTGDVWRMTVDGVVLTKSNE